MYQATSFTSQEKGFYTALFPYNYGYHTSAIIWVSNRKGSGDKLCARVCNPNSRSWNSIKDYPCHDLVFLFHDPNTNLIVDQCIDLTSLTTAQVLHIAQHYYVNNDQRHRISRHLATKRNSEIGGILINWAEHPLEPPPYINVVNLTEAFPDLVIPSVMFHSLPNSFIIPAPPADPAAEKRTVGRPVSTGAGLNNNKYYRYRMKAHKENGVPEGLTQEERKRYYQNPNKNPDNWTEDKIDYYMQIDSGNHPLLQSSL